MAWQTDIENYYREGDNLKALKQRFIELCHLRKINMALNQLDGQLTPYAVGEYVFAEANAIDASPRGGIIGQHWSKDLEVLEALDKYRIKGSGEPDADENALVARALQIADNELIDPKDRVAALRLASELKGKIKKAVEGGWGGGGGSGGANQVDFLAALSAKLPN